MTESAILETIDAFWAARLKGDTAAVLSFASSDAEYEMVGASGFGDPKTYGPAAVAPAAARLIDDFKFHSLERLTAIISGDQAVTVHRFKSRSAAARRSPAKSATSGRSTTPARCGRCGSSSTPTS